MYLNYYGLKEEPFTLSPNPKFLFYSKRHRDALSQFIYAINKNRGYMVLTGEAGTGKTSLVNAMQEYVPTDIVVGNICYTALDSADLLKEIYHQFGLLNGNNGVSTSDHIIKLQKFLQNSRRAGKKVVLLVDEAQDLSDSALEHIRLLTNFESMQDYHLQLILIGQPELNKRLYDSRVACFRERIGFKSSLGRLDSSETKTYIHHRLKVAGCNAPKDIFLEGAMSDIYTYSRGIPRRINILCDHALLFGYSKNMLCVNSNMVREMIQQDNLFEKELQEINEAKADRESEKTAVGGSGTFSCRNGSSDGVAFYDNSTDKKEFHVASRELQNFITSLLSEQKNAANTMRSRSETTSLFLLISAVLMMGITLISEGESIALRLVGILMIVIMVITLVGLQRGLFR